MKAEEIVALDVARSARSIDENGYMHVALSHITKAQVVPYYGHEIPAWEDRGLEKDKLYYAFRSPDELKKSIPTWNGLPIHLEHHVDSADDPQKWTRVGSSGTNAKWASPYVDNSLTIWDLDAQEKIEDGSCKELSCAYRYLPDFTAGEFEGIPYDFVMRDIKGNHIALVEKGRAGRDVVVADAAPKLEIEPKKSERTGVESMAKKSDELEKKGLDDELTDEEVEEKKTPEGEEDEVTIEKDIVKDDDDDDDEAEDDGEEEGGGDDDEAKMNKFVQSLNKDLADKLMGKLQEAFPDEGGEGAEDDDEDDEDEGKPAEDDDEDLNGTGAEDDDDEDEGDEDEEKKMKAFVEALTDTQAKKLVLKLKERLIGNAEKKIEGEDKTAKDCGKTAKDCGAKDCGKPAMDSDTIRKILTREFRARSAAVRTVRRTCGDLDPMAFDSASDIYGHALKTVGIATDQFPRSSWAGMYAAYITAMDNSARKGKKYTESGDLSGSFAGLKNIMIGE